MEQEKYYFPLRSPLWKSSQLFLTQIQIFAYWKGQVSKTPICLHLATSQVNILETSKTKWGMQTQDISVLYQFYCSHNFDN